MMSTVIVSYLFSLKEKEAWHAAPTLVQVGGGQMTTAMTQHGNAVEKVFFFRRVAIGRQWMFVSFVIMWFPFDLSGIETLVLIWTQIVCSLQHVMTLDFLTWQQRVITSCSRTMRTFVLKPQMISCHRMSLCGSQSGCIMIAPAGRLKNRLTPICPTRGDLPFAFRPRAKNQQFGPVCTRPLQGALWTHSVSPHPLGIQG